MRFKLIGVLAAAALMVGISAIAATGASAVTFTLSIEECNGTILNDCWSEKEEAASPLLELVGEQDVTVKQTSVAIFKAKELEVEIECKEVTGAGKIKQPEPLVKTGVIEGTLTFKGCKLLGKLAEKCEIPAEKATEGLTGGLKTETELQLKPANGKSFIKLDLKDNKTTGLVCPATVKGEHEVTGEQIITILKPGEHELTKKGTSVEKSGLKFIGKAAELSGGLELSFTGLEDFVDVGKA